jgi:hypothetical protein
LPKTGVYRAIANWRVTAQIPARGVLGRA